VVWKQTYHGPHGPHPGGARGVPLVAVLGSALAAAGWRAWRRRRPFRVAVAGWSMAPALLPGDLLVAAVDREPVRGSMVVVPRPDRPELELVKRVLAVAGDRVDGRLLSAGELWVIGDDPSHSTDSRTFGPVRREAVRGVVRFRYWPPRRIGPVA
jgi:type IV secretory pathway protease TraF